MDRIHRPTIEQMTLDLVETQIDSQSPRGKIYIQNMARIEHSNVLALREEIRHLFDFRQLTNVITWLPVQFENEEKWGERKRKERDRFYLKKGVLLDATQADIIFWNKKKTIPFVRSLLLFSLPHDVKYKAPNEVERSCNDGWHKARCQLLQINALIRTSIILASSTN